MAANKWNLSILGLAVSMSLLACSPAGQSPTATGNTGASAASNQIQSLQAIEINQLPAYAIKPAAQQVSLTGQLRIPANMILSAEELSGITAPPQGITAPPQGITAPPQGITAPPQGILAAQPIFGIRSVKSNALSTNYFVEFFRDNFKLALPEINQTATINQTVLQYINGQPYFVASYMLPALQPGTKYQLKASHPLLNLQTQLQTSTAGQTLSADLDLGSTAVDLVKKTAQERGKKVNLAYLGSHIDELERTVATALQDRFKERISEKQLQATVGTFVDGLPAYVEPQSIQIQTPTRKQLRVGEQIELSALTHFVDQSSTSSALWLSSAGDRASVQADGTLVALQPGQVTIQAQALDNSELNSQIVFEILP